MDSETGCAVSVTALFSFLLVAIDSSRQSSFSRVSLLNGPVFLYLALVVTGNAFTTILASTATGELFADLNPKCFLFAFIGVFGFEIILKQVNVTFADFGVLTISDWITAAKDAAIARAIKADALDREQKAQALAQRLAALSDETINAHVIDLMSQEQLAQLDAAAAAGNADPKLIKALALAKTDFTAASAIASTIPV